MKDILDGAKQLLSESIDLIGDSIKEVIIVGGWGPYLRHPDRHPGTKDVDILFPENYSKDRIIAILDRFLDNGFFISAKNDFQLCRAYQLGKQTYIYNVDLLHPTEGKINKVDFVEIMDLDVTVDGITVKPIITINIKHGDIIFSRNLFEETNFEGKYLNILDGAGIVLSKMESCHNRKRPRDIFDIYISLSEPSVLEKVVQLSQINPTIANVMEQHLNKLTDDWEVYESHLRQFGVNDSKARGILLMNW